MKCRHCAVQLAVSFIDLGSAPPSNSYLTEKTLRAPEQWFPLRVLVCDSCWLVQTEDFARADELFDADYAYFSSYSSTWLRHAEGYVRDMTARYNLTETSHVVEVAANDGYLLQYVQARGIPCLGVEPTASTASVARTRGLDVIEDFFGTRLAGELVARNKQADLMTANNVLAHVPDINDFVAGFAVLLKPLGVATFEFPHLLRLVAEKQFDTIYHEHFSYLSLVAVQRIFAENGLSVFDVEELPTHGGSLRVHAQRLDSGQRAVTDAVRELTAVEARSGVMSATFYQRFQTDAERVKNAALSFLLELKASAKVTAAYGAAAKGNTFMNYAGIRPDLVKFVVDLNPAKQGKFMPGSRIPIVDEAYLRAQRPDIIIILPWNLRAEVIAQLDYVRAWGGRFVTLTPELQVS